MEPTTSKTSLDSSMNNLADTSPDTPPEASPDTSDTHKALATADIIMAVFGVAGAISLLRDGSFQGFTATAQTITAATMLVATATLLLAGMLLHARCGKLGAACSGACLGATACFVIAQITTYGGLGPWYAVVSCVLAALAALTVRASFRVALERSRPSRHRPTT